MSRVFTRIYQQGSLLKSSRLECFCPSIEGKIISRNINTNKEEDRPKDPALRFFKWGFQPLPTQTVFGEIIALLFSL